MHLIAFEHQQDFGELQVDRVVVDDKDRFVRHVIPHFGPVRTTERNKRASWTRSATGMRLPAQARIGVCAALSLARRRKLPTVRPLSIDGSTTTAAGTRNWSDAAPKPPAA